MTLDSSAMGFIREPGDTDYFELDLSGQTGNTLVRVYTVGSTDTVGELQNSGGTSQGENDDGRLSPGHTAFLIEGNLSAGDPLHRRYRIRGRDRARTGWLWKR